MSFFQTLLAPSGPQTPLSRYTFFNGLLYLGLGASLYVWPGQVQVMMREAPFAGQEEGYMRIVGLCVALIGWFYVAGSRTRADSFGLATVVDRVLLPFFLVPLGVTGAVPGMVAYLLAVADPILGIGAYLIWRRQRLA